MEPSERSSSVVSYRRLFWLANPGRPLCGPERDPGREPGRPLCGLGVGWWGIPPEPVFADEEEDEPAAEEPFKLPEVKFPWQ